MTAKQTGAIVHVGNYNGITKHYFDFLDEGFDLSQHTFACLSNVSMGPEQLPAWSWLVNGLGGWLRLACSLIRADKVILHGLFSHRLVLLLCLIPWVLPRCYWVMWGGDFMQALERGGGFSKVCIRWMRVHVIRRIGYLLTYIPGDLELVRNRLEATGKHIDCIMYPSNVFEPRGGATLAQAANPSDQMTLLVGNSADPSNEHDDTFQRIQKLNFNNCQIVCPLSYGDVANADRLEAQGKRMFGDKFMALRDFMSKEDYLSMLEGVDIAVFAHWRQQGMGNIINLIGFGKKVYLRNSISSWSLFETLGVKVFPLDELSFEPLDYELSIFNSQAIERQFSYDVLAHQWCDIFDR